MKAEHKAVFEPLTVGRTELRNRVVAPPMVQVRPITSHEGIAWYRGLAAGGAGLVIVEATGIPRFGDDLTAAVLEPLAAAIHDEGAAAAIQLFPLHFGESAEPDDLSPGQIREMAAGFARAAEVCKQAGFDGVEPHGAHGFLLNKFFMPDRNHREDEYGGSFENRCRLGVEIVRAIRDRAGDALLILYRHTPKGKAYSLEDSLEFATRLVGAGTDILDISPARDEMSADLAAPFKRETHVPVIAVGGMECPDEAAGALNEGRCDLVALGRQLICDSQWPFKVRECCLDEIVWCTKCNVCFDLLRARQPVECAINPRGD